MKFHILTIFPDMINQCMDHSILKRAREANLISVNTIDIREFSKNKHRKVDDYPYGGGNGMVMTVQPIYDAFNSIKDKISDNTKVIFLSPTGRKFNQDVAKELSKEEDIVFLCGHYEGIDRRAIDLICNDNISIGDFVLTGGEIPAVMIIDAVSRLIPNVLHNSESHITESFEDNLLEHHQYTRPAEFMGMKVPEILLNGNHKKIDEFRRAQSESLTREKRPDLWEKYVSGRDIKD